MKSCAFVYVCLTGERGRHREKQREREREYKRHKEKATKKERKKERGRIDKQQKLSKEIDMK